MDLKEIENRCNFRCPLVGRFAFVRQLLILFVPVAQVVGIPMGIVTAIATAIVVAVTGVNCVEVIHTKAIL